MRDDIRCNGSKRAKVEWVDPHDPATWVEADDYYGGFDGQSDYDGEVDDDDDDDVEDAEHQEEEVLAAVEEDKPPSPPPKPYSSKAKASEKWKATQRQRQRLTKHEDMANGVGDFEGI